MATLYVPITKAKGKIAIESDDIPIDMYQLALLEGLKVLLNRGMTGAGFATAKLDGQALVDAQAACMAKAEKNLADLKASKLTKGRTAGATKTSAPVRAEAMRLARLVIRDEIRSAGMIPSRVESKVITEAAKQLVESDESYIKQAAANLETKPVVASAINLSALGVHESDKLRAKAEADKAERAANKQLSAKQAGKVAPRKVKPEHRA